MALTAPGATATPLHPFLETFGSANQPSFSNPKGVAIYQATGDVYVMDHGSPPSIKRYHPDGTPADFSALGTNAIDGKEGPDATPQESLGFGGPGESQIAVDNSGGPTDGDIYVTQSSPNRINIFSATGAYLGQLSAAGTTEFSEACGVAVDPSGAVYVGDYGSGIHKFVPSASPPVNADNTATFTTTSNPCTLAAGAGATAGFLFPAQYYGPVSKIDSSTGELKYSFSENVTTVSVDPASGNVYAVRGYTADSEFKEFDASGAASATQLSSDALSNEGQGISVRGSTGHVFVSRSSAEASHLEVFGPLSHSPNVTATPANGITATEATLNGTVDPEGVAITECKFEYWLMGEGASSHSAPCEGSIPADSSDHAVSAQLTGLAGPGSLYHFRLVAKNAGASGTSALEAFRIGATINGASASTGIEEATLRGAIVPSGGETDYHFEWGTTGAYGNPTPTQSVPTGEEPVAVSAGLVGLAEGQTYHFRLIATNDIGTTVGPDQTLTTALAPPPFPQRGYEVVSDLPTGGVPILPAYSQPETSEDGTRVVFQAVQPLPGSSAPLPSDHVGGAYIYQAQLRPDRWQLTQSEFSTAGSSVGGYAISADATHMLTQTNDELDPDDRNGENLDVYEEQPDGTIVWVSRDPRLPVGTPQTAIGKALIPPSDPKYASLSSGSEKFAMSTDGGTVVFYTDRPLLDTDTTPFKEGGFAYRLYKWHEGQLSFIGRRPDGSVPSGGSTLSMSAEITGKNAGTSAHHTVSQDGSRVIFGAGRTDTVARLDNRGQTLYIQTDGQPTVDALKEEGVPPIPAVNLWSPTYRDASADGSRVFYTTQSRLTLNSGGQNSSEGDLDLYAYDVGAGKVRDLTPRLDGIEDPQVELATADRAGVLGVPAVSEDGTRVYFVAKGQYDVAPSPQGQLPAAGSPNLYVAEINDFAEPMKLRFVATLGVDDEAVWQSRWNSRAAEVSPDGSVLAFGSSADLVSGYPTGGTEQMYVYDVESETLSCASCPMDGSLPKGAVDELPQFGGGIEVSVGSRWQFQGGEKHWVVNDGTVFFDTPTALLPDDHNSAGDVYGYRDGKLQLISGGTGRTLSRFENASPDGRSVFFTTTEALAPQDNEPGTYKLYDARVGGGFPGSSPPPPCDLSAGACEATGTSARQSAGAGTAAFEGPGNPKPRSVRSCPRGKRKVRLRGKVRCVKHRAKAGPRSKRHQQKRNAKHDRRAGR